MTRVTCFAVILKLMKVTLRLRLPCRYLIKLLRYHLHHKPLFALVLHSASSSSADFIVYSLLPVASAEYGLSSPAHVTIIRISHFPNPLMPLPFITPEEVALTISIRPLLLVSSPLQAACLLCSTDPAVMLSLTIALYVNEFDLECVFVGLPPCVCVCVCVTVSCRKPDHSTHASKREEEGAAVRKRNAALQFLFSPVMRRGLAGRFKRLM